MSTRFGAWVARARLHARLGRPMPTNTVWPSRSSCAAAAAMNSEGRGRRAGGGDTAVLSPPPPPPPPALAFSVPIVHRRAKPLRRAQPFERSRVLRDVPFAIPHSIHPLVQIPCERRGIARDGFPREVEAVVTIVEALRIRRVCTPRFYNNGVHDRTRYDRAIGVGTDDVFLDELLRDDDHVPRCKRCLPLNAEQPPDLCV